MWRSGMLRRLGVAMGFKRTISVTLLACLFLVHGCAANRAKQAITDRERDFALNRQSWIIARTRLKQMCPKIPASVDEYRAAKAVLVATGTDPFKGCDARLIKISNGWELDDWHWDWLPSYQTIVEVHVEEARKLTKPHLYEEYMAAIAQYAAVMTDRGEITPFQFRAVITEGWRWMIQEAQKESILMQQNLVAAQQSDAAVWNALGKTAAGLAVVATAALGAAAVVAAARTPTYVPVPVQTVQPISRPVNCFANRTSSSTVWVTCR